MSVQSSSGGTPAPAGKFPIKLTYDANLLALITLVISLGTLAWQIVNYVQGADVRLIAPNQITIGASDAVMFPNRAGGPYVHFIMRYSYVNQAAAGYNATVREERLRVTVSGHRSFEYRWFRFVSSDAAGPNGTQLKVDKIKDAQPFPVAAASSDSHETLFQPWQNDCPAKTRTPCDPLANYVGWTTFLNWFAKDRTVEFELLAYVFGSKQPVSAKCKVTMPKERFDDMVQQRWGSPICVATQ